MKYLILITAGLLAIIAALFVWGIKDSPRLSKWVSVTLRPPLQSDNYNETLKLNRMLSNPVFVILLIIAGDIVFFFLFNFIFNTLTQLPEMLSATFSGKEVYINKYINSDCFKLRLAGRSNATIYAYIAFFIFMVISDIKMGYMMRISYSEKAINKGNSGTSRWTTVKEVMQQYKEIEMRPLKSGETTFFKGKGGLPVMRWRDKLYIDTQLTNNLFLGATRSGKGEMFVFTLIDIFSRALKKINRPSMIIFDPKIELYKSSYKTLQERGYEVDLINLDNPMKSAGYNPLAIITEYYKNGKIDEAQQLTKSFAFGIFNNSAAASQDPIWPTTATDLWTAMIISVVSDCIEEDTVLNASRMDKFARQRQLFDSMAEELTEEELDERREMFARAYLRLGPDEDFLSDDMISQYNERGIHIPDYIPDYIVHKVDETRSEEIEIEYKDIYPNEKNINCFSVLNFFRELVGSYSESTGQEAEAGAKKAETLLDDYFNNRPPLDFAAALYSEIKEAGDRTKGSVYITMQSALSIFMQDNIARLTAESDIDIGAIGFDKEKPHAVFISIPTEDKANHFLALTFVTQVFQYLWKLSKEGTNKLDREVEFILDEFGNMPVFDNFDGMVTNCLGAGMAFNIFIQSYNQLHSKYEMDMDTIKDNFANHVYILAVGQESANEFSEQLGNRTIIEVQRSGTLLSTKKNLMENNKERPLLYPAELQKFREGEVAIIRAAKRTDKAGAAIESFPIYCEYQTHIYFWWYIIIFIRKIIFKRMLAHDLMKDRDDNTPLTMLQEYKYWISQEKRRQGTAFFYRWQYATDAFPNPTEINFSEVFEGPGRENIRYRDMVVDINAIKEKLGLEIAESDIGSGLVKTINDLDIGYQGKYTTLCFAHLGYDFKEKIGLSDDMPVTEVSERIQRYIEDKLPEAVQKKLQMDGFLSKVNSVLFS